MNIQNISKEKKNVTVELNADELVMICNLMHSTQKEESSKGQFNELYSDLMMARDLCKYGHVDNFCLSNIVKCRDEIRGVLSEDEAETFDSYLESNDMKTAFGNSDFRAIYRKIVGCSERSDKIQDWMRSREYE